MVSKLALARLKRELRLIIECPPELITARPDEKNMLVWHYLLQGPPDTDFVGGWYWGKLRFPKNYPMGPPSITMVTPNGRFEVNSRLCLSISDFHPETWEPSWAVSTVLTGLLSFMVEDTRTAGSIETTSAVKRQFAKDSLAWNTAQEEFNAIFPDFDEILLGRPASSSSDAKPPVVSVVEDVLIRSADPPSPKAEVEIEPTAAVARVVVEPKKKDGIIQEKPVIVVPLNSKVIIHGLRTKPYFNGMEGEIFGTTGGRYKVRVNGTALALKTMNFIVQ
eukprot:GEMP01060328.1.p1 GENE.GEMP01060328.1~~GEMP01060328.1.p1  ORF type:complete len:278 (+),score=39.83 GEMP01060328.1:56-889(+)